MNRVGDDILLERMNSAEEVLLSQADGLDMKASYLLVVLVFLAQLSTTFLSKANLTCLGRSSQWVSCALLAGSGLLLLLELGIKAFRSENALELEAWRDKTILEAKGKEDYGQAADKEKYLRDYLVWGLIVGSRSRIAQNEKNNEQKVKYLKVAYWLAFAALALDILFATLSR